MWKLVKSWRLKYNILLKQQEIFHYWLFVHFPDHIYSCYIALWLGKLWKRLKYKNSNKTATAMHFINSLIEVTGTITHSCNLLYNDRYILQWGRNNMQIWLGKSEKVISQMTSQIVPLKTNQFNVKLHPLWETQPMEINILKTPQYKDVYFRYPTLIILPINFTRRAHIIVGVFLNGFH